MVGKPGDWNKLEFFNKIVDSGLWAAMTPSDRSVFGVLFRHADYWTGQCFLTTKTIANKAGANRRIAQAAVRRLISYGILVKKYIGEPKKRRIIYTFLEEPKMMIPIKPSNMALLNARKRAKNGKFLKSEESRALNMHTTIKPSSMHNHKPSNMACKNSYEEYEEYKPSGLKTEISKSTIEAFIKEKGRPWVENFLRSHGYPLSLLENGGGNRDTE
jgi:hypothetical protein